MADPPEPPEGMVSQEQYDDLQLELDTAEEAWEGVVQTVHDELSKYKQEIAVAKIGDREARLAHVFMFFDSAADGTFDKEARHEQQHRQWK